MKRYQSLIIKQHIHMQDHGVRSLFPCLVPSRHEGKGKKSANCSISSGGWPKPFTLFP
eukprot:c29313_g1_i2 orf=177-350(-)